MAELSDTEASTEVACPECEQIFATEKAERRHYTLEHNQELLLHNCEWCKKKYASSSALKRHHASRHPDRPVKRPLNVKLKVGTKRPASTQSSPTPKKVKKTGSPKVDSRTVTRSMTTTTEPLSKHSVGASDYEDITPPRRSPDPPNVETMKDVEAGKPLHTLTSDQLNNTGTPVLPSRLVTFLQPPLVTSTCPNTSLSRMNSGNLLQKLLRTRHQ